MKLIFIRHGEPDYSIDSLTEKGWREAEYLAQRISKLDVTEYFVSPLGRAQDTSKATMKAVNRTAITKDWLREFNVKVDKEYPTNSTVPWDWMPGIWTKYEEFFDKDNWVNQKTFKENNVGQLYRSVTTKLDELLEEYGYRRNGFVYDAVQPNHDTLVFFCHFGLECVLLSHLMNVSPLTLWHGTCSAPTGVTILATEERVKGTAYFRMLTYADVSHLYANGEEPSFAARFCETFDDVNDRH